jgi:hypothetical protein
MRPQTRRKREELAPSFETNSLVVPPETAFGEISPPYQFPSRLRPFACSMRPQRWLREERGRQARTARRPPAWAPCSPELAHVCAQEPDVRAGAGPVAERRHPDQKRQTTWTRWASAWRPRNWRRRCAAATDGRQIALRSRRLCLRTSTRTSTVPLA